MADPAYDAFVAALHNGQFYMYTNVATLTALVIDYIATLDYEVEYMWPLKFNLVSILFILTRYLPVADMIITLYIQHATNMTVPLCSLLGRLYVWLIYAGMGLAEGLLMIRVWALYGKGRRLTVFLLTVYVGAFTASGVKIYLSLSTVLVAVVPVPGRSDVCFVKSYDQQLYLYWVFMIVVDAVSCILLLVQLARAYRTGGLTNLMRVVYQDGVIFYLVLLCFSVVNIFAIVMLPTELSSLLTAPERVLHAVLAGRVILSTRHQVREDKKGTIAVHTIPSFDAGRPEQLILFCSPSPTTYYSESYTSPVSPSSHASFYTPNTGSPPSQPPRSRHDSASSYSTKGSNKSGQGPIFEAAAEKQRQRQKAKTRRSQRMAQRCNQNSHLPSCEVAECSEPFETPAEDNTTNQI